MGKDLVGLEIGPSHLAAARVSAANGSQQLLQVAYEPFPGGIVSDGDVRDVDALAAELKKFFKKHKLPRRAVRVGVGSDRVGVRTIELSGVADPKQLVNAVRFRAQEVLPIALPEAVLDFHVLSEGVDDKGVSTKRVLIVVAYRDLVERYASACKLAGLRLVGVDLEAFALLRALAPRESEGAGNGARTALVAVAVGAERTTLAVSDGATCEFTRVLDWGGESLLTTSVARPFEVDEEAAEQGKTPLSFDRGDLPSGLPEAAAPKAAEAVRDAVHAFARELVSSLQFYQAQPGSLAIREIVLVGASVELGALAADLQRLVGVVVRIGDPLVGVSPAKKLKGHAPDSSHAIAIGLAIGT